MRVTRAQARAKERRGRRVDGLVVLAAIVLGLAVAWIVLSVQGMQSDLRESNKARDALARQVESLGGKPVAGPPGSRGAPGKERVGAVGPSGPPGPPGKDAPTLTPSPGPKGERGATGMAGANSTVPGPTGPAGQNATGAPGKDGQNGVDGSNGADGTNGKDGKDGKDGENGQDGKDGAPPSEWTYTDQNGLEYRCTPVDDFDPADPRYQCTPTSAPPDQPEQAPSPSQQQKPSSSSSPLLPLGLLSTSG
jgi:hypothetical protein